MPSDAMNSSRSVSRMLDAEIRRLEALRQHVSVRSNPALRLRLERAAGFALCPVCSECQADGVPCASADRDCEKCVKALETLREIRTGLEAEIEKRDAEIRERLESWNWDLP